MPALSREEHGPMCGHLDNESCTYIFTTGKVRNDGPVRIIQQHLFFEGLAIFGCSLCIAIIYSVWYDTTLKRIIIMALTFAVFTGIRSKHLQSRAVAIPGTVVLGVLCRYTS